MPKESNAPNITEKYKSDPELATHLALLGLETVEQYQVWCARNHLSTRVDKHWRQRCQERYLAAQGKVAKRLKQKKRERRTPRRILAAIFDAAVSEEELTQPHLVQIHQLVATIDDLETKNAFRRLVLFVEARTRLLSTNTGFQGFGAVPGNTFIDAILSIARHYTHWLRPLDAWKCQTRNASKQFSSLTRHLLAKYSVPLFMDSAWFLGNDPSAACHQNWFLRIGNGESPRKLDLPLKLTKRMAHHFLLAPKHYSLNEALRYGQVVGLGGDRRLAEAVLGSRIGRDFEHTEFWQSVVHWLARCLLYTSPSPRDATLSRMPSSA